ncbi:PREDICTED: pathogenesis-related protein 5-like [Camelina sativa]|uniref:Pathogenesis-related protein 5-like n=1 Tax=Camelina sativa TaxID=90675 RepID=A0ABM0SUL6_CAMSA|nr:PREDICTED: pathogenesis-related protein 5-like [Camelina sativa]
MANYSSIQILFLVFFITSAIAVSATVFTLQNSCPYTVWPGILSGNDNTLGDGGFPLTPGASVQLTAPAGWSGRFWARTGCNFDASGHGNCVTGDCGGVLKCNGGGVPPVTLAEFTLVGDGGKDFYDVSLVDGYNVEMGIKPQGGSGDCHYAGCVADVNAVCPNELRIMDPHTGIIAACKSACAAFNSEEFCCTGAHATPQTCSPTHYSAMFKSACPGAYSYAYDDATSTFTCSGSNYLISFCPTRS